MKLTSFIAAILTVVISTMCIIEVYPEKEIDLDTDDTPSIITAIEECNALMTIKTEEPKPNFFSECAGEEFSILEYEPIEEEIIREESGEEFILYDIPLDYDIQKYIISFCEKNNFDPVLVFAVIRCESNYDIYCNYKDTDFGLMQINKNTFSDYGITIETVYDPYVNVDCGMQSLLRHYKAVNGDLHKTLVRYNCGANGAKKLFNKGIYETKYSRKVLSKYQEILDKAIR